LAAIDLLKLNWDQGLSYPEKDRVYNLYQQYNIKEIMNTGNSMKFIDEYRKCHDVIPVCLKNDWSFEIREAYPWV
jgi:hypothetical protein